VRDRPVPVDDDIATLARWVFCGVVLLPTAVGLAVGLDAKLVSLLTRGQFGSTCSGLLTWLIFAAGVQLALLAVGLTHYLSGVMLHGEAPATPAKAEPGVFHHE